MSAVPELPREDEEMRAGQDYALFFAVDDYENMNSLSNPVQNATDLAKELEDNYGFETEVVSNPDLLTIERKLKQYRRKFRRGHFDQKGQLFIFFSGHGLQRGRNGYFVPGDGDPETIHRTGVEYDWLRSEIDNFACQHILVMIDACHSITFDPSWESKTDRDFGRNSDKDRDKVLTAHQEYQARLFITSDAVGDETPDRSSLVREFLRALHDHYSPNGYLTHNELLGTYLKGNAFPTPGGGEFGSDHPSSRFLFFRVNQDKDVDDGKTDLKDWAIAQELDNCDSYRAYIEKHPRGDFVSLAREKRAPCEAEERMVAAWQRAKNRNECEAYESFVKDYPRSPYTSLVSEKLRALNCSGANILPYNMMFVKGGIFDMGDQAGDGAPNEKPVHPVTVDDFYIGQTEVTFEAYDLYCAAIGKKQPDDKGWGRGNRPVINVSWLDAVAYCNWRSREEYFTPVYRISGETVTIDWSANGYRLPTEAEWEYAARGGGRNDKWAGTAKKDSIMRYANFCDQTCTIVWADKQQNDGFSNTAPVGSLQANRLGLSDMSGNVWEWCWDKFGLDYYKKSPAQNPRGPKGGISRVLRGGSWDNSASYCRTTTRHGLIPAYRSNAIGFRLARSF